MAYLNLSAAVAAAAAGAARSRVGRRRRQARQTKLEERLCPERIFYYLTTSRNTQNCNDRLVYPQKRDTVLNRHTAKRTAGGSGTPLAVRTRAGSGDRKRKNIAIRVGHNELLQVGAGSGCFPCGRRSALTATKALFKYIYIYIYVCVPRK